MEAYGAMDGEARTRTLFRYERAEGGESWNRVGAISPKVAELMLGNGADEKQVRRFSAEPIIPTNKSKGGRK